MPRLRTLLSGAILIACGRWYSSWPLLWIALIPWFSTLDETPSLGAAAVQGFWLAATMSLGLFSWIASATRIYLHLPLATLPLLFLVSVPLCQPQMIVGAVFRRWILSRPAALASGAGRLAAMAASAFFYAGFDALVPKLFHDTLGHGFIGNHFLLQAADLGGAHLLTFVIFFFNEAAWDAVRARRKAALRAAFAGALAAALFAYGFLRARQLEAAPASSFERLSVALIQGNTPGAASGREDDIPSEVENYLRLSDRALAAGPKPDLVIWPESAYPSPYLAPLSRSAEALVRRVENWIRGNGIPLVFGTYDPRPEGGLYNTMMVEAPGPASEPQNFKFAFYHKSILFPIGEEMPEALAPYFQRTNEYVRGEGPSVLELPLRDGALKVCPIICFESVFPGHAIAEARLGGRLLLDTTNDVWFDGTGEPALHFMLARFRSVETRLPLLRATHTGITAAVTPDGEISAILEPGRPSFLRVSVGVPKHPAWTLMKAWGDWFGRASLLASLALSGALIAASAPAPGRRTRRAQGLNETAPTGNVTIG